MLAVGGRKEIYVTGRHGDEKQWKGMRGRRRGRIESGDGKGYAQELRIPWKLVTKAGKAPAKGKLELGIDLAWNATPAVLCGAVSQGLGQRTELGPGRVTVVSDLAAKRGWGRLSAQRIRLGRIRLWRVPGGDNS